MATKYYAMIDGVQKGPFSLEELPAQGVRPSTYIWCKGMDEWQKAEDNPDVCRLFRNHLYDIMHPGVQQVFKSQEEMDKYKIQPDAPKDTHRSRFDRYLEETGNDPLPTIEEIDSNKDTGIPPVNMIGYAWLVTILCFFPTGIVALVYSYKSKNAWNNHDNARAHEFSRQAKMWTGITFFIGVICYGVFLSFSM